MLFWQYMGWQWRNFAPGGFRRHVVGNTLINVGYCAMGGSVAEWLACWTQVQKGPGSNRSRDAVGVSGNSLRQTVHTDCASVYQAAKLVAAFLRVAWATAGLAESNGSLLPGLWLMSPAGWLPRIEISSGILRSVIEYGIELGRYRFFKSVSVFGFLVGFSKVCIGFGIGFSKYRDIGFGFRLPTRL